MANTLPSIDKMLMILSSRQNDLDRAYRYSSPQPEPDAPAVTIPPALMSMKTRLAWCQTLVFALEERMELKDVKLPGDDEFTAELRRWVDDGDLREALTQAHEESLRTGIGFIVTSAHPDLKDTPLYTAESPSSFYAHVDQRTGKVLWAIRSYKADPSEPAFNIDGHDRVTVYEPNWTRYYVKHQGKWKSDPEIKDVNHKLGEPPVEALINRRSRRNPYGVPEHKGLWDLQNAAFRSLTGMQVAQEFASIPQKVIMNADEDDFTDDVEGPEGEDDEKQPVSQAELILRRYLVLTGDASIGEYSAAQLSNFTTALSGVARQASAVSGLPLDFLGISSDANPASGDAIRGNTDRLVKRALRFLRGTTPAVVRLIGKSARMIGHSRDDLARIQVLWADPSTSTPSALADAALKMSQIQTSQGKAFTRKYIWKYMEVPPDDQQEMEDELANEAFSDLLNGGAVDGETDTE